MENGNRTDKAKMAAIEFPTQPVSAVLKYARLTDEFVYNSGDFNKLYDEMLSLLPPYRHPLHPDQEILLYFGEKEFKLGVIGFPLPKNYENLKDSETSPEKLKEVYDYIKDAEETKIALNHARKESERLKNAEQVYSKNQRIPARSRNSKVVQALELSKGVRPKSINPDKMYRDYFQLVRREGLSRTDATEMISVKYGIISSDATLKLLLDHRKVILDQYDELFRKKVKILTKGFILWRDRI